MTEDDKRITTKEGIEDLKFTTFKWRAILINPTFKGKMTWRVRFQRFWGNDIFVGKRGGLWVKVPVLKAWVVGNVVITIGIVQVMT